MQLRHSSDSFRFAATDLSAFVGCRHRTALDMLVATGKLPEPPGRFDPHMQALRDKGAKHEQRYVDSLRDQGLTVRDVREAGDRAAATLTSLRDGVDVVVQGLLEDGDWRGFPDILRRIEGESLLGPWAYEVYDTKLARETRGSTILQLSVYSSLLTATQGTRPERFHVVTPHPAMPVQSYRVDDYAAYVRLSRELLHTNTAGSPENLLAAHYPEPVDQCEYCRWSTRCDARRRDDDHLSFIAGASCLHRDELVAQGISTLAAAAAMPLPIAFKPSRGSADTYVRVREQARLQHEQRTTGEPKWEVIPRASPPIDGEATSAPAVGLSRLPEPSANDIFLDLEAARFAREGGREYLFGIWIRGQYHCWWAHDDAEERAAFEAVMDVIMRAWDDDPGMHVYHFGHYEPSAFRRLEGRHTTRTESLDRLLRAGCFVDLYAVVRQAVRAGVESYSIKALEQYYGFTRDARLRDAGLARHALERALEAGVVADVPTASLELIARYNADDCRSTEALRDWLEGPVRERAIADGLVLARPAPLEDKAPEVVSDSRCGGAAPERATPGGYRGGSERSRPPVAHPLDAGVPARLASPRGAGQLVGVLPRSRTWQRRGARRDLCGRRAAVPAAPGVRGQRTHREADEDDHRPVRVSSAGRRTEAR
jgi:uncharacterized protein